MLKFSNTRLFCLLFILLASVFVLSSCSKKGGSSGHSGGGGSSTPSGYTFTIENQAGESLHYCKIEFIRSSSYKLERYGLRILVRDDKDNGRFPVVGSSKSYTLHTNPITTSAVDKLLSMSSEFDMYASCSDSSDFNNGKWYEVGHVSTASEIRSGLHLVFTNQDKGASVTLTPVGNGVSGLSIDSHKYYIENNVGSDLYNCGVKIYKGYNHSNGQIYNDYVVIARLTDDNALADKSSFTSHLSIGASELLNIMLSIKGMHYIWDSIACSRTPEGKLEFIKDYQVNGNVGTITNIVLNGFTKPSPAPSPITTHSNELGIGNVGHSNIENNATDYDSIDDYNETSVDNLDINNM